MRGEHGLPARLAGHAVAGESSRREGSSSSISAWSAAALLVDIAMPGEDGYALLREIRQRGLGVPAIAVTAHAGAEWRRRSLDAGFMEHLDKPVDLDRLIQIMTALAAASRQARPAVPADAYDEGD
jgi:CheY-like chemotaxis protein